MTEESKFSERYGFKETKEAEISVRNEAPYEFRGVLVDLAYECGFRPKSLRTLLCRVLRKRADQNNWSEYPNIDEEIRQLVDGAEWYKVYDVVEAIANTMHDNTYSYQPDRFENELNAYFLEHGIGWKLESGVLSARNPEALERTIKSATASLEDFGNMTAKAELHEALADLSRRPAPDITGAIQHAMAALECVARDVIGDHKATLGELLKKNPDMVPAPMNSALEKLWGFASEYGRHIREGRNPDFNEAQLIVGICAAVVTFLLEKKNV